MSAIWFGPAYTPLPSRRPCDHNPPDECRVCTGEAAEERDYFRATPTERRAYLRDLASWRSRRDNWATTRTDDASGDAA